MHLNELLKMLFAIGVSVCLSSITLAQGESSSQNALPDGEISRFGRFTAWLINPTTRYNHGVLGDAIEAGGFIIKRDSDRLVYRLPHNAVFEDRRVRLVDFDDDGVPEAIIVKSYLRRGAAIAVYRIQADRIEPLAESEAIGISNRWLNPIGVADFAGTGKLMIAAIVTPHLVGSLRLYQISGRTLEEVARLDGYTNHILGERDLDLARVVKMNASELPLILTPSLNRRELAAISLREGTLKVVQKWSFDSQIQQLKISDGFLNVSTASHDVRIDLK